MDSKSGSEEEFYDCLGNYLKNIYRCCWCDVSKVITKQLLLNLWDTLHVVRRSLLQLYYILSRIFSENESAAGSQFCVN